MSILVCMLSASRHKVLSHFPPVFERMIVANSHAASMTHNVYCYGLRPKNARSNA
jgi:hypothetical protein